MSLADKLNRNAKAGIACSLIGLSSILISGCNTSAGMYGASVGYRVGAQNALASGNIRGAQALGVLGSIAEFTAQGEQQRETAEAGRSEVNQNVYVAAPVLQGRAITVSEVVGERAPVLQGRAITVSEVVASTIDLIYKKHNVTTYDLKDENGRYPVYISNDFVDKNGDLVVDFPEEFTNPGKTKFSTDEKVRIELIKARTKEQVVLKSVVRNITRDELVEDSGYFMLPNMVDLINFYEPGELKPGIHQYIALDNNNKIIGEIFFEVYEK